MKQIPGEQTFVKRRKDDPSNGRMVCTKRGCKQHYWVKLRDVDVFEYEPTDADGYRDVDITVPYSKKKNTKHSPATRPCMPT
jgi:hypothetical protein